MPRLLFHVQYLKGLGHLRRIALIAEAAARDGADVHIVSGGLPLPGFSPEGVTIHQLPALYAGAGGFSDLCDEHGAPISDAWKDVRRDALLALYDLLAPDLLLIETFPFGRRMLGFEMLPLIEAARDRSPRPAIVCSIRDILQKPSKPGRLEETLMQLNSGFDAVVVHGDPLFMALEESFPAARDIGIETFYSGLVAPAAHLYETGMQLPDGDVVVSCGAGAIGQALLEAAIQARAQTALKDNHWRLITGPHLPEAEVAKLAAAAPEGVTIERFLDDFPRVLRQASLSISYAGYNTAVDILRSRTRAVLVSYSGEDGGESEQAARAARMEELGFAVALPDTDLSAETLGRAITRALEMKQAAAQEVDLDGADKSAAFLLDLADHSRT